MGNAIHYIEGDATCPRYADLYKLNVIVHCCNDQGGWGSGFVVALSKKWKTPEQNYRSIPKDQLILGDVSLSVVSTAPPIVVANLIGQHGVGNDGPIPPIRYEALRKGFRTLVHKFDEHGFVGASGGPMVGSLVSIHMPRIGSGLAGGDWALIEPLIESTFIKADIDTYVYSLPGQSAEKGNWLDSRIRPQPLEIK